MKLAIMQPYVFPYIGYFQLIYASDKFVAYDDVSYIKQGWINRNKILLNGAEHIFTIPLKNASSFVNISDTGINLNLYDGWKAKFQKTLHAAYSKAPHFAVVSDLVMSVLSGAHDTISGLAADSLMATSAFLGIATEFCKTSAHYGNNDLKAQDRILDICKMERAAIYNNPTGGRELYSKEAFAAAGLQLRFIKARAINYRQFNHNFVPWLSIIDIMMFNSPAETLELLKEYDIE